MQNPTPEQTEAGMHAHGLMALDPRDRIPATELVERVADIMGESEADVRRWLKASHTI